MAGRASRIVIGIGNPERGDDAVGRAVVRRLVVQGLPEIEIAECSGEAAELLELLGRADAAFLVDAGRFEAAPGTLRRLDARQASVPLAVGGTSSHGFGLAAAIELARALARLPPCCLVYLVQGARYDLGAALSPAVKAAVPVAVAAIRRDVLAAAGTL